MTMHEVENEVPQPSPRRRQRPRRLRHRRPPLTVGQVLAWADHEFEKTGRWPQGDDGEVLADCTEKWRNINAALHTGGRGLPKGTTLAWLIAEHRGVRNRASLPRLTEEQILTWADHHFARTGRWPLAYSGPVLDDSQETWRAVELALLRGGRGLPGGTTLARLLATKRGVRNKHALPPLTEEVVLRWARRHCRLTGQWPHENSGPVPGAPGERWKNVDQSLRVGGRGFPGGDSLGKLLARRLGVRNKTNIPPLSEEEVLRWADQHYARTGAWPNRTSGPVVAAPGERWRWVDEALRHGHRSLAGGSSLARLLAERRDVRNPSRPPLSVEQVLEWADDHFRRHGVWPSQGSGAVEAAPGEKWGAIDNALLCGGRGLPGGSSLARLLAEKRGKRNRACLPPLTVEVLLEWIDEHFARTGRWPSQLSGPVQVAPGENWAAINLALRVGVRGLRGGDSLPRFIRRHRGRKRGSR